VRHRVEQGARVRFLYFIFQRVSILAPLALFDAQRHASAIDVAGFQGNDLTRAQPDAVGHRSGLGSYFGRQLLNVNEVHIHLYAMLAQYFP